MASIAEALVATAVGHPRRAPGGGGLQLLPAPHRLAAARPPTCCRTWCSRTSPAGPRRRDELGRGAPQSMTAAPRERDHRRHQRHAARRHHAGAAHHLHRDREDHGDARGADGAAARAHDRGGPGRLSVIVPATADPRVNGAGARATNRLLAPAREALAGNPTCGRSSSADGDVPHGASFTCSTCSKRAGIARVAFAALPADSSGH